MPRLLLVADDASFGMIAVERVVSRLAQQMGSAVHVVVVGPAAEAGTRGDALFSGSVADPEAAATAIQARFQAAGVQATMHVKRGPVSQGVLDAESDLQPDVLVLGSSERSTLAFPGYGGVLDHVKDVVGASILVVRGDGWTRVAAGLDGSQPSLYATAVASGWAAALHLPFVLLVGQGARRPVTLQADGVEEVTGDPGDFLLQRSQRHPNDLLVVGSRGSGNPGLLQLGSVSDRVCWAAQSSVLVVRPLRRQGHP